MALNTVTTGNTVLAADINQLVNVLQRAAGQTETGKYFIGSNAYVAGATVSMYVCSLSRGATPVSVTIDTSDGITGTANPPSTSSLTANGFQVKTTSNAVANNVSVAGNYTIQY